MKRQIVEVEEKLKAANEKADQEALGKDKEALQKDKEALRRIELFSLEERLQKRSDALQHQRAKQEPGSFQVIGSKPLLFFWCCL
jgi:predicted  nucleic acid-binding Zn-ribbon protein